MRCFALLLIGVLCGVLFAAEPPAQAAEWVKAREAQRKGRQALEKGAAVDRIERGTKAAKILAEVLAKNLDKGAYRTDSALLDLLAGVQLLNPEAATPLKAALAALPEQPPADRQVLKSWNQVLELKRKEILKPTEKLAQDALKLGVPSVARDCVDQALTFWPQHRDLRFNMGMTAVGNRWYGPHDLELTKQGLAWDDKLGWIKVGEQERYVAGEYYDIQEKSWTTIEAANALHAVAAKKWVIQREHVQVQGTAPLAELIDTANRLEAFYDQVFSAYSGFFVKSKMTMSEAKKSPKNKKDDLNIKLLFGMLDHPRLVVNVAKDKQFYQQSLPPMVKAGWSDGMFISSTAESYFYSGSTEVVYHEFTHQILHIFSGTSRSPAWLAEGAAVYTQGPQFHHGRLVLGQVGENSHLRMFIKQQRKGEALALAKIIAIEDGRDWMNSETPDLNYPAAGAVVQFCMEAEERRYRADFLDYLRDCYRGETRNYKLWEYLGLDYSTFETKYEQWLTEFTKGKNGPALKAGPAD